MVGLIHAVEPQLPTFIPRLMDAAHAEARPGRRPPFRNGNTRNASKGTLPPRLASEDRTMPKGGPAALVGTGRMGIGPSGEPVDTTRKGREQDQTLAHLRERSRRQAGRHYSPRRLHELGPTAVVEFLDEIHRHHVDDDLDRRLEAYVTRLTPRLLFGAGSNRLSAGVIRVVGARL
jgi:hypothetical protein